MMIMCVYKAITRSTPVQASILAQQAKLYYIICNYKGDFTFF